jgi:hypothetical protein
MEKSIFLIITILSVASCSYNLVDAPKHKTDYIKNVISCDARTTKYTLLNPDELAEYLQDDDHGSFWIKYEINKTKEKRKINIYRFILNDASNYSVSFERKTFPYSECRKIKTKLKYLK